MGPLQRFQAAGLARRAYPVPVGTALARLRAARAWRRDAGSREDALTSMELLVGSTHRAAELHSLARAHLFEAFSYQELVHRPEVLHAVPVRGLERLRAEAAKGKGVIQSKVHQGQFGTHTPRLARHGVPITSIAGAALFGDQPATLRGSLRRQLLANLAAEEGVTVVPAVASYGVIRDLLLEGRTVTIACDLMGSTPVRFLGRTFYVPSGTARLSLETGAPIVPLVVNRHGRLEQLELQEPLLPAEHSDHRTLLQAVFDRHAPAVLAWPEAMERPVTHFSLSPQRRDPD